MHQDKHAPPGPEENGEGDGHLWLNIGKIVFLVAVLVAAWLLLDWLMGDK